MKAKINLKKGILLFTVISMLVGCGINVIPTLITKDITLAKVTVSFLQDKAWYQNAQTLDLTKATNQIKSITKAKIKSFKLKIGEDFKDTKTNSTELQIFFIVRVVKGGMDTYDDSGVKTVVGEEDVLLQGSEFGSVQLTGSAVFDSANREFVNFELSEPFEMKDHIVDGKLSLSILLYRTKDNSATSTEFNDASFSFDLSVATEVEVEL